MSGAIAQHTGRGHRRELSLHFAPKPRNGMDGWRYAVAISGMSPAAKLICFMIDAGAGAGQYREGRPTFTIRELADWIGRDLRETRRAFRAARRSGLLQGYIA
jgi:hypothetical protein